jgi:hypothetical protein
MKPFADDVNCTLLACHCVLRAAPYRKEVTNDVRRHYEQKRFVAAADISWPLHFSRWCKWIRQQRQVLFTSEVLVVLTQCLEAE